MIEASYLPKMSSADDKSFDSEDLNRSGTLRISSIRRDAS